MGSRILPCWPKKLCQKRQKNACAPKNTGATTLERARAIAKTPQSCPPGFRMQNPLRRTIGPVPAKFLYEKHQQSACERSPIVASALQPTWRGSPCADCGENRRPISASPSPSLSPASTSAGPPCIARGCLPCRHAAGCRCPARHPQIAARLCRTARQRRRSPHHFVCKFELP